MDYRKLNVVKMENQNEFDWLYLEEKLQGMLEQPSAFTDGFEHYLNNFFEFDPCPFPYQNSHIAHFEFKDFEYVNGDFSSWDFNIPSFHEDIGVDDKLLNPMTVHFDHSNSVGTLTSEVPASIQRDFVSSRQSGRSKSAAALELDEIQKYFDVPITKAAKELKVGLTVLKKRCRELNIMRWPHRKIKSLKSLIDNVKELGLTTEIEMLEEHRKMLEKLPELELTERTKKLRQACFKANYKKRRSLAALSNV